MEEVGVLALISGKKKYRPNFLKIIFDKMKHSFIFLIS